MCLFSKLKICLIAGTILLTMESQGAPDSNETSKVIYGVDDRMDVRDAHPDYQNWAKSTVAIFNKKKLVHNPKNKSYQINGVSLGDLFELCDEERFIEQMASADCSGFFIGDDKIVTAGHCINNSYECKNSSFVFGYQNFFDLNVEIKEESVFSCKEIISREFDLITLLDFAVIRLDRKVSGIRPLALRKKEESEIEEGTGLVVIGHPSGLPAKIADGAYVIHNDHEIYFNANLDTFGGNSGSAVLNQDTGVVEGILVRGESDYLLDPVRNCYVSNKCKENGGGCQGEGVTRITVVEGI